MNEPEIFDIDERWRLAVHPSLDPFNRPARTSMVIATPENSGRYELQRRVYGEWVAGPRFWTMAELTSSTIARWEHTDDISPYHFRDDSWTLG